MKNSEPVKHMVAHKKKEQKARGKGDSITWRQLTLIGIGSVIGAGFFLGTGISISITGPAVLIGYLIAGIAAFLAFSALSEMTVNDPQEGSFRTYARKAFGHRGGFISGWMYWMAGVLIMSSEITALSTFTRYWFHNIPLWIFAGIYSALGLGINLLGVKDFGKIESLFAIIKTSTLAIFILFGLAVLFGWISPADAVHGTNHHLFQNGNWFPHGFSGFWTALLFVFFSFGGIAVVGVTSNELQSKKDVPKAGIAMIVALVGLYILSLFFVLNIASWTHINHSESPFVTALSSFKFPYIDSIFNIIVISASFSTMVGALFSITSVMVSLAGDGDAPDVFTKRSNGDVPVYALMLSAAGLVITVVLSFLLPKSVYEYLTAAAGVMLLLNWVWILLSQIKNRPHYKENTHFKLPLYPYSSYLGIFLVAFAISGAFFKTKELIGLIIAVCIVAVIYAIYEISVHFFSLGKSVAKQHR